MTNNGTDPTMTGPQNWLGQIIMFKSVLEQHSRKVNSRVQTIACNSTGLGFSPVLNNAEDNINNVSGGILTFNCL